MKSLFTVGLFSALLMSAGGISQGADLKAGDKAPAFELKGSDGRTYRLSDFAGSRAVVIAWYPKAFTGG